MHLSQEQHDRAAADLIRAEQTHERVDVLTIRHPEMDMDDAYAIQSAMLAHKLAAGRTITGWKIGLTSRAMQLAIGIDTPDSGILFDDMHFNSGATVPLGRFIEPRIEAEIAFVMKSALAGGDCTREDIIAATDYVVPALEILDARIHRRDPVSGKNRKVFDSVADNASNAGIVLGQEHHAIDAHDLRWVGAIVSVDGTVEETGLGAGVLNDPVESVLWLARRMAGYGQRIEAGQVVLSGSFIRPLECPPGTVVEADYGAFGSVSCTFAKA